MKEKKNEGSVALSIVTTARNVSINHYTNNHALYDTTK